MMGLGSLIKRDCKLFFKDKGMFFTSLITPIILLVLYITFLGNVFRDSFASVVSGSSIVSDKLIDATVASQLLSSLLAVSCVTVAFCSNLLMVQDKVSGARKDLTVTPVKKSTLALGYFISSALVTLIICYAALAIGLIYVASIGWYMSAADVMSLVLDVFLLSMFGTGLSSVINCNLSTSGQCSAVGTIVSAGYGFICGAYMPMSNFSGGLQKVLSFFPGTYGTSLIRNHCMAGVFKEMSSIGFPSQAIDEIKNSVDCNIYFSGEKVSTGSMYMVLGITVIVVLGIFILLNILRKNKK